MEPTRADARDNRARILEVAEDVFARGGSAASTEEVARLAGVGIATVFRHFPTKRALLEAVLVKHFDHLCERARGLADSDEPGPAFFEFFGHLVDDAAGKLAIIEAFTDAGGDAEGQAGRRPRELREAVGVLLVRAQEAGAVRADVRLEEVYALLVGVARAGAHLQLDAHVRARTVGIVFDGLAARERDERRPVQ
ncbi:TetR/AcrR family transcriptional regulator [Actinomadura litoris]|uniref:TetR family transcriptional regulator n=1 Tax=Actinomadura litoris TaxID=2678616 RepID=A0A7K1L426_9ACTN|nr:TetR/AcrR family transcriptional regulator [Actinomadura litoris]MUN39120.1 TetR family transcriptional regulator [Actinomadura litoris]